MPVLTDRSVFLLSGQGTGVSAFGSAQDMRAAKNYGLLEHVSYSPSAVLIFQGSRDGVNWVNEVTVTATPTTAHVQMSAWYPYVRGAYSTGWSVSASANLYYAPGIA